MMSVAGMQKGQLVLYSVYGASVCVLVQEQLKTTQSFVCTIGEVAYTVTSILSTALD